MIVTAPEWLIWLIAAYLVNEIWYTLRCHLHHFDDDDEGNIAAGQ